MVTLRFIDSSNGRKDIINLFTYPDSLGMGTPVVINDSIIRIPIDGERRLDDLKVTQSFSAKGDILMSIEKGKSLSFDSLIKANKGKVIYIDFWASWCMPCRREMPDSRLLQKEYANQDTLFFYLSVDEQYSDWQIAFKSENMSKANSFLFLNTPSSTFLKKYKIDTAIPRYMIVGRNGDFVNIDAPRPSDPELKQILNELLVLRK